MMQAGKEKKQKKSKSRNEKWSTSTSFFQEIMIIFKYNKID